MFVKIVNHVDGHAGLYECHTVMFNKLLKLRDKEERPVLLIIDIEDNRGCKSIEVDREVHSIFVLNDQGKTIDSYKKLPDNFFDHDRNQNKK